MANYRAGADFERAFMKWAETTYACSAHRSAGSHSLIDVILIPIFTGIEDKRKPLGAVVVCQLKRSKSKADKQWNGFNPVGCVKWWVSKPKGVSIEDMKIEVG